MATEKKRTKSKRTAGRKAAPMKKAPKKKKAAPKKAQAKAKASRKAATAGKSARRRKKQVHRKSQGVNTRVAFAPEKLTAHSGEQSGDLQGLSHAEVADSESVDELLEEGNAFEAEAVKGVEDVGDADERGVRTHEVPEDDVPGEYLDKEE